ncbi:MAG TPA: response regulator [Nitrososphaeraceae archaeon]|nr:response regulator [Nitrososphaeraceae archaeon]
MSFQKPNVFIIYKNEDVNSLLAGTFWLKGFEPFKFIDGKESLKRFREIDGKVDAVVIDYEIALDNGLMLIVNIKRINPNTKVLIIAEEESKKIKMYEYGADEVILMPLSPTDISDKILLSISKRNLLEKSTNDLI